jgi:hypothetical protein
VFRGKSGGRKAGTVSEKPTSEVVSEPLMREHEVLFLDFLGFASAVEQWDDQRMERLIRVLAGIAEAQSSFDVRGEAQQDGSYKITSPAEITTFSDNIVVSYPAVLGDPADPVTTLVAPGWAQMVRQQMQRITAEIVRVGLDVGLLTRGGLSRGRLYHGGRVVAGEAMVDAYRLERCIAKQARVAVSPRLPDNDGVFVDADGTRCLDYFTELMLSAERVHGDALVWARATRTNIDATIETLTKGGRQKEAAKWRNFRDWFCSKVRNSWPGGRLF